MKEITVQTDEELMEFLRGLFYGFSLSPQEREEAAKQAEQILLGKQMGAWDPEKGDMVTYDR